MGLPAAGLQKLGAGAALSMPGVGLGPVGPAVGLSGVGDITGAPSTDEVKRRVTQENVGAPPGISDPAAIGAGEEARASTGRGRLQNILTSARGLVNQPYTLARRTLLGR